jgi:general stress protein 26
MKTDQEIVSEFIKAHKIAVISTVSSDYLPHSAVVGIYVGKNSELVFGTFKSSRKYQNLKKNSRVSLVIGWDSGKTVQYEGDAEELEASAVEKFEKAHLDHMSTAAKYVSKEEAVFFKITPRWIRYTDTSKDPWEIIEIGI